MVSRAPKWRGFILVALLVSLIALFGCTVGPNYKRPTVDVPGVYRGAAPDESDKSYAESDGQNPEPQKTESIVQSLGDEKWFEVFQDKELQELIRTALKK